jgi:dUTPase
MQSTTTVLGGVINPDYHGEIGLPLHNGVKQDYVWSTGDPLGHLEVLPCPVIKVNGIKVIQAGCFIEASINKGLLKGKADSLILLD